MVASHLMRIVAAVALPALLCGPAAASLLSFTSTNFNPFNSASGASPVGELDGIVRYDKPRQFDTYGEIDFFQLKLDGVTYTPTNATVYLGREDFFGLPLLNFEGDVANFNGSGSSLHFLLVNEYQYGAAMNVGYTGGALEWQSLDVRTRPRNPAPWPTSGIAAPVPEPASDALMLLGAGCVSLVVGRARRRLPA